jgi:hypothetical protein
MIITAAKNSVAGAPEEVIGTSYLNFFLCNLQFGPNRLERLSLANLSKLVQFMRLRSEPTIEALLIIITLGWKGLP